MPKREPRPAFSDLTRLVYARLDTSMPFNRKTLKAMIAKHIVIPVSGHPVLRKKFREAKVPHKDIYAIPFRRPHQNYKPQKTTLPLTVGVFTLKMLEKGNSC